MMDRKEFFERIGGVLAAVGIMAQTEVEAAEPVVVTPSKVPTGAPRLHGTRSELWVDGRKVERLTAVELEVRKDPYPTAVYATGGVGQMWGPGHKYVRVHAECLAPPVLPMERVGDVMWVKVVTPDGPVFQFRAVVEHVSTEVRVGDQALWHLTFRSVPE